MTVEEYLRSLVPGLDLQSNVVARAARSPIEVQLERLEVDDDIDDYDDDDIEFQKRLDYASSTIYYSVLGVFTGGYSEQVGDVRNSRTQQITQADRQRYKTLADNLRRKWGFEIEGDDSNGELFDAGYLRLR